MALQILSFHLVHITVIGAGNWILATLRIVDSNYIFKCGGIVLAELTGVRSLLTLLILVGSDVTTLEPLPTLVHTLHCHKLTPVQLNSW
jgi:hypothetical protein